MSDQDLKAASTRRWKSLWMLLGSMVVVVLALVAVVAFAGVRLPAPKVDISQAGDVQSYVGADADRGPRVPAVGVDVVGETSLRVSFKAAVRNGRSCDRYHPLVAEDAESVRFTIAVDRIGNVGLFNCDVAEDQRETQTMLLQLDKPLGDRRVIDVAQRPMNAAGDELPVEQLDESAPMKWESYEAVDETTIRFKVQRSLSGPWASCHRHRADFTYDEDEIVVSLYEGPLLHAEQLCEAGHDGRVVASSMHQPFTLLVDLDEPINGRDIVASSAG